MNTRLLSEFVLETRGKTRIKYEDFIKDGEESEFLHDLFYRRAFEFEFRRWVDSTVESGDGIVIRDRKWFAKHSDECDSHSAWLMSAQAERCFPSCFVDSKNIDGMDEDEAARFLVNRKYGNYSSKKEKWNKYKKGKGKNEAFRPDNK